MARLHSPAEHAPDHRPVQLTLQLFTGNAPRRRPAAPAPYWVHADFADVGGQLCPRNHAVRVQLSADVTRDGFWIGYCDVLFTNSGTSGPIRPLGSRQDALAAAAHSVSRHCQRLLTTAAGHTKADVRAAKEVVRWLKDSISSYADAHRHRRRGHDGAAVFHQWMFLRITVSAKFTTMITITDKLHDDGRDTRLTFSETEPQ